MVNVCLLKFYLHRDRFKPDKCTRITFCVVTRDRNVHEYGFTSDRDLLDMNDDILLSVLQVALLVVTLVVVQIQSQRVDR